MHTTASRENRNAHDQDGYGAHLRASQELYGQIVAMPAVIRTRLLRLEFKPEFLELANRALEEADLAVRANSRGCWLIFSEAVSCICCFAKKKRRKLSARRSPAIRRMRTPVRLMPIF